MYFVVLLCLDNCQHSKLLSMSDSGAGSGEEGSPSRPLTPGLGLDEELLSALQGGAHESLSSADMDDVLSGGDVSMSGVGDDEVRTSTPVDLGHVADSVVSPAPVPDRATDGAHVSSPTGRGRASALEFMTGRGSLPTVGTPPGLSLIHI